MSLGMEFVACCIYTHQLTAVGSLVVDMVEILAVDVEVGMVENVVVVEVQAAALSSAAGEVVEMVSSILDRSTHPRSN